MIQVQKSALDFLEEIIKAHRAVALEHGLTGHLPAVKAFQIQEPYFVLAIHMLTSAQVFGVLSVHSQALKNKAGMEVLDLLTTRVREQSTEHTQESKRPLFRECHSGLFPTGQGRERHGGGLQMKKKNR